jgi:thiamine monophosphate synthase
VAIGGITLENAASVLHAGADALAVISALSTRRHRRARAAFARLFAAQPRATA